MPTTYAHPVKGPFALLFEFVREPPKCIADRAASFHDDCSPPHSATLVRCCRGSMVCVTETLDLGVLVGQPTSAQVTGWPAGLNGTQVNPFSRRICPVYHPRRRSAGAAKIRSISSDLRR